MVFKQKIPEAELAEYVLSIVYYKDFKVEHTMDKFLPDGTTNLVINLYDEPRYIYDNSTLNKKQECKECWFSGMQTEYLTISSDNESEMLVVSFKAGGSFPFIDQNLYQFINKVVHAKNVFPNILELRTQLIQTHESDHKIKVAEDWLKANLKNDSFSGEIIQHFVKQIQNATGSLKFKEIAKQSGYSQKQFIHLFKKHVGLTPKQFHRIVRFNEILNAIFKKEVVDWTYVVHEFGYYDQAHFIKDFQAFSGHNPKKYIDEQGDWQNYIPLR